MSCLYRTAQVSVSGLHPQPAAHRSAHIKIQLNAALPLLRVPGSDLFPSRCYTNILYACLLSCYTPCTSYPKTRPNNVHISVGFPLKMEECKSGFIYEAALTGSSDQLVDKLSFVPEAEVSLPPALNP